MGAWGLQFDENDDATDWLADFEDQHTWELVRQTLEQVQAASDEYLEAPESCMGLAAAEVVAAGMGKPSERLPTEQLKWATANSDGAAGLRQLARDAVSSIRDDSELLKLWREGGEPDDWLATVDDLLNRLN